MRQTLKLPRLGETAEDAVILEWYRRPGDAVVAGEPLLRVETNKAEVDIPSAVSGTLVDVLVADGDEIGVGVAIAVVEA
jgi:pyruvate/2-oxoglutarate dehydrogenase complex dihydrolipoamide acyltransferase (E2) component